MNPEFRYSLIVEQPILEFRFRYKVECRTNSSILGVNTTPQNKTFPTIRINGYSGQVQIEVSCVGKDYPYRPHPFRLVSRDTEDIGVFRISAHITEEQRAVQLQNMGIQCVKKDNIHDALRERQALQVDPFNTGYEHSASLGKHHLRLAIQVKYEDGSRDVLLTNVITDLSSLHIATNVPPSGSAHGGTKIVLLTKRFTKDTPLVRFATGDWYADAQVASVHMMCALTVITPPYRDPNTDVPVEVEIYLYRPSVEDDEPSTSNRVRFEYTPEPRVQPRTPAKRKKTEDKKLHPSLLPDGEDSILMDISACSLDLPLPSNRLAEHRIDDSYNNPQSMMDLDRILLDLIGQDQKSQPSGSPQTPNHETNAGQTSIGQHPPPRKMTRTGQTSTRRQVSTHKQTPTGQPSTSMGHSYTQTSIGQCSSMGQHSPHSQNFTHQHHPKLEEQLSQNRVTSTDDLISFMGRSPAHKNMSTTIGQTCTLMESSSRRQPTMHRQTPTTGQSRTPMGPPTLHRQNLTNDLSSLTMGRTSFNKQLSDNPQHSPISVEQSFSNINTCTRQVSSPIERGPRLSAIEQNFLNQQISALVGQSSQNTQFSATQASSSGYQTSRMSNFGQTSSMRQPSIPRQFSQTSTCGQFSQTLIPGQFSQMEQNLPSGAPPSSMQHELRNRPTDHHYSSKVKPHVRPYFTENVSNCYDWRSSTSPGQDSPNPNCADVQTSTSRLGAQMESDDLQLFEILPDIQQIESEVPNIDFQIGEIINSGLPNLDPELFQNCLEDISKSIDQLSTKK